VSLKGLVVKTNWLAVNRRLWLRSQSENKNENGASPRRSRKKGSAEDWLWVIVNVCDYG
jgi:hypothetical protein